MKKLLSVALAFALSMSMAVCFSSCGDDSESSGTNGSKTIKETHYNADGSKSYEAVATIEGDKIILNGDNGSKSVYRYDPNGTDPAVHNVFLDEFARQFIEPKNCFGKRISRDDDESRNEYTYEGNTMINNYYENGEFVKKEVTEFDPHGIELKFQVFMPDGTAVSDPAICKCDYDAAGNVIAVRDDSNRVIRYEYDSENRLTKLTDIGDELLECYVIYEYDGKGNNTKCTVFGTDDKLKKWFEYEYNDSNDLTKAVEYDSNGNVVEWHEYEYNF